MTNGTAHNVKISGPMRLQRVYFCRFFNDQIMNAFTKIIITNVTKNDTRCPSLRETADAVPAVSSA